MGATVLFYTEQKDAVEDLVRNLAVTAGVGELGLELRSSESRAQGSPWRSSGLRVQDEEAVF